MIDLDTLKGASLGDRPVIGIAVGDEQVWPRTFVGEWPGDNGDPWPASMWTVDGTPGSSATVDGAGNGVLNHGTGILSYVFGVAKRPRGDVDLRVRVVANSTASLVLPIVRWDGQVGGDALPPRNGYFAFSRPNSSVGGGTPVSGVRLYRAVDGVVQRVDSLSGILGPVGDQWWRLQAVGTTIRLKWWLASASEPASWAVSVTDSTHASGLFGIGAITAATASSFTVKELIAE